MEISILLFLSVSIPQRNDELCKESKHACLYFICHLYTNRALIKIHFGGSGWGEFICEEKKT